MLMFGGLQKPTCCRECPVREEHYSTVCDNIRCRISDNWNDKPDTIPAWCPAQAVEPVECIIEGVKNPPASELLSLLTKADKFCKIGGEENESC